MKNHQARKPFDWLDDRQLRHGSLPLIRQAVRHGWLVDDSPGLAERRSALIAALFELMNDRSTSARDVIMIGQIFFAMDANDTHDDCKD